MLRLEDILDDAVRYLHGEMDAQERAFFEALLEEFPHLREELQVMDLARQELAALEREAIPGRTGKRKPFRVPLHRYRVLLIAAVLLAILAVAGWLLLNRTDREGNDSLPAAAQFDPPGQPAALIQPAGPGGQQVTIETFGGNSPNAGSDHGKAVCWLPSGELAFAGTYEGKGSIGTDTFPNNGKKDIWLAAYGQRQGFRWVLPFGGQLNDEPQAIAADEQGNILVTGSFSGTLEFEGGPSFRAIGQDNEGRHDFFVAKFNPDGGLQWFHHGGGDKIDNRQTGRNTGRAIAATRDQGVIVAGSYVGAPTLNGTPLPPGGPLEDAFLASYTADGALQWVRSITSDQAVQVLDVGTDSSGNIFATGFFGHQKYGGRIFFAEDTVLTSAGGRDIFLAKYSPDAQLIWVRQAGSPLTESNGYDHSNSLALDAAGNCYLTGRIMGNARFGNEVLSSYGGRDIFVAKYDPQGELLWASHAGSPEGSGPFPEDARSIALTPDGGALVTGSFTGTARFDRFVLSTGEYANFFLAKYTPTGEVEWARQFDIVDPAGFGRAAGLSVSVSASGQIAVSGFFSGVVAFNGIPLTSNGAQEVFILFLDENGNLLYHDKTVRYV